MDEIKHEWLLAQPRDMRRNTSDLVDLLSSHNKFDWLPHKLPDGRYPLDRLPAAQVNPIKNLAVYIVVAAALGVVLIIGCCVWCCRHHAWLHREHTEDEKQKIIEMKSMRNLNPSSSNIGASFSEGGRQYARASSAYTR